MPQLFVRVEPCQVRKLFQYFSDQTERKGSGALAVDFVQDLAKLLMHVFGRYCCTPVSRRTRQPALCTDVGHQDRIQL